jgi:hypothetical protein
MFNPICHYFGGSRDRTIAVLIMDAARYDRFAACRSFGIPAAGRLRARKPGRTPKPARRAARNAENAPVIGHIFE